MNPRRGLSLYLTGEVGQQVVAVDVHLERRVTDLEPLLELVDDVGIAGGDQLADIADDAPAPYCFNPSLWRQSQPLFDGSWAIGSVEKT